MEGSCLGLSRLLRSLMSGWSSKTPDSEVGLAEWYVLVEVGLGQGYFLANSALWQLPREVGLGQGDFLANSTTWQSFNRRWFGPSKVGNFKYEINGEFLGSMNHGLIAINRYTLLVVVFKSYKNLEVAHFEWEEFVRSILVGRFHNDVNTSNTMTVDGEARVQDH
ncbi:hypothetical protein TanjilG_05271 [Lupinus angustifolius]|uniref:Uncharacterized protein n=1 Tax=Lupinus angustifolius TaxID=3871 RepID=A0A4P1RBL0_LUPAN|nr:hypothetical protein TanjilG_05271 [Lupinus angustifolius]